MTIWGVDIGVRSYYAASNDGFILEIQELKKGGARSEELRHLSLSFGELVREEDLVVVEEPPLAGSRNIRTALHLNQTVGAILSATPAKIVLAPVSAWKKAICGNGNAGKDDVRAWLEANHPEYHDRCAGNQNLVDATVISFYGAQLGEAAAELRDAGTWDLGVRL